MNLSPCRNDWFFHGMHSLAVLPSCRITIAKAGKNPSIEPITSYGTFASSEVCGEYRTREFEVLAGDSTTRTEVIEYGHRFIVDLSRAYFSARLSSERQRILEQVTGNEILLDMFAGVGPFAITLAARATLVVASDFNPQAVILMLENCARNHSGNLLPVLSDAHHLAASIPLRFDRIVMNLPLTGVEFLPDAFQLCKDGG